MKIAYKDFSFSTNLSLKLLRKVLSKMLRKKESFTKETIINLIQNGPERTH